MNRKKLGALIVIGTLFALFSKYSLAGEFAEPILLTSCGQSADVLMVKTLLTKDSLDFSYVPQAGADDLKDKGSVIIVVGGSSKGLGAAKISAEDEITRVISLLAAADTLRIPILCVHIGGAARRGSLSDPFNQLGAEHAWLIIVAKGGNGDGFFTKIAEQKRIPLRPAESALKVGEILKEICAEGK